MGRKAKKRRQSHGSAWHWKQTDCWYYTLPGAKKRVSLFDKDGQRIRGKEHKEAAEIALAREKLSWEREAGVLPGSGCEWSSAISTTSAATAAPCRSRNYERVMYSTGSRVIQLGVPRSRSGTRSPLYWERSTTRRKCTTCPALFEGSRSRHSDHGCSRSVRWMSSRSSRRRMNRLATFCLRPFTLACDHSAS